MKHYLLITATALLFLALPQMTSAQKRSLTKLSNARNVAKKEIRKSYPIQASKDNEEYLAYCSEETDAVGVHEGTISAAAYFPASIVKRLTGNSLTGIATNILDENAKNLHLWVSTTLDGEHDIADIAVAEGYEVGTPIVVSLDTPYEISEQGLYIGLTMDCTDGETAAICCDWDDRDNALFYQAPEAEWEDWSHTWNGSLYILGVTTGDKMFANTDVALSNITSNRAMIGDETEISLNVYNYGKNPIDRIAVEYVINGETHTADVELYNEVTQFQRSSTTLFVQVPEAEGRYDVEYTITSANDAENINNDDASRSSYVIALEESVPRIVFIEQTENIYDEWESVANLAMQKINEEQYDGKAIAVGVHGAFEGYGDDDMTDDSYSALLSMVGAPYSEFINRKYIDYAFETYYDEYDDYGIPTFRLGSMVDMLSESPSEASLNLTAEYADDEQNSIVFRSKATFNYSTTDEVPYRIAYILAEEELPGQIMYNRYNREFMVDVLFDGDEDEFLYYYDTTPVELKPLFDMPYEIEDATYLNVARSIYNCFGIEGSITGKLNKGEERNHTYIADMPKNIANKDKLYAVALLIDGYSGEVVNAARCSIDEYTGITAAKNDGFSADINVVSGKLTINTSEEAVVEVYDIKGRKLASSAVNGNLSLAIPAANGVAVVRIVADNNIVVKRVVL